MKVNNYCHLLPKLIGPSQTTPMLAKLKFLIEKIKTVVKLIWNERIFLWTDRQIALHLVKNVTSNHLYEAGINDLVFLNYLCAALAIRTFNPESKATLNILFNYFLKKLSEEIKNKSLNHHPLPDLQSPLDPLSLPSHSVIKNESLDLINSPSTDLTICLLPEIFANIFFMVDDHILIQSVCKKWQETIKQTIYPKLIQDIEEKIGKEKAELIYSYILSNSSIEINTHLNISELIQKLSIKTRKKFRDLFQPIVKTSSFIPLWLNKNSNLELTAYEKTLCLFREQKRQLVVVILDEQIALDCFKTIVKNQNLKSFLKIRKFIKDLNLTRMSFNQTNTPLIQISATSILFQLINRNFFIKDSIQQLKNLYKTTPIIHQDFFYHQLTHICDEIGYLNLTSLTFDGSEYPLLVQSLMKQMNRLTALHTFTIKNLKIEPFVHHLLQLTNLNSLTLDNNQLKEIPQTIFQMTHLNCLSIENQQKSKSKDNFRVSSEIAKLSQLTTLNLSANEILKLPAEMGYLTNLRNLNLAKNLLKGPLDQITPLTQLKTLNLSDNAFSEFSPFYPFRQLELLYLSYNQLKEFPVDVIQNFPLLRRLDLSNNPLDTKNLPTDLQKLRIFQILIL